MSLRTDQLEDSFIYNEYSAAPAEVQTIKPNYYCKCILWNPCCRFIARRILAKELGQTLNEINQLSSRRNKVCLKPPGSLRLVEKGSFQQLRKQHLEHQNPDHINQTMEDIRTRHNLKITIPKLKTKGNRSATVKRRKGLHDSDLNIPTDLSGFFPERNFLEVMNSASRDVPKVIDILIHKDQNVGANGMRTSLKSGDQLKTGNTLLPFLTPTPRGSTTPRHSNHSNYTAITSLVERPVSYISGLTMKELEKNWSLTLPYIRNWVVTYKKHRLANQPKFSIDRWVVLFYTSSEPLDDFSEFGCLFVRELFIHHRVAYEEKDVAIEKTNYKSELMGRLHGGSLLLPYVFVSNLKLGGCRVIWALHRLNLFHEVFGDFMMKPEEYENWRFANKPPRIELMINVPLKNYPSLEVISQGQKARLNSEKLKFVQQGKELVKESKEKWKRLSAVPLQDFDWFLYVMIKETIKSTFHVMDMTFWNVLFPKQPYSNIKQMRQAVDKLAGASKK